MDVLDALLPETRLHVLRCVCGGAESLPAQSLRALLAVSKSWYSLSLSQEILPFARNLHCQLLTPANVCKRSGEVWPPGEPLQVHRTQDSQPLGDHDVLIRCLQICLHRRFQPALELYSQLEEAANLETWIRQLEEFRLQQFPQASGPGDAPPPSWCAAATVLPHGRLCVVGGGCYSYELINAQSNIKEVLWHQPNVYMFDLATQQWSRQDTTGSPPPAAHTYASAHTVLGSRWVFWCGGYYGQAYNTAYALDIETWEWRALRNGSTNSPTPRYFVASFEHLGALYAWGGRSSQDKYCNDLWRLDRSRAHQDIIHTDEVAATGSIPPPRFGSSLTNCDDRFAVLFGGGQWKTGGRFLSDSTTYSLNLNTHEWSRLQTTGLEPMPRLQHSAVNLGGNLVLIFGGYEASERRYLGHPHTAVLNARSLQWMQVDGGERLRIGVQVEVRGEDADVKVIGAVVDGPEKIPNSQHNGWHVKVGADVMLISESRLQVLPSRQRPRAPSQEDGEELPMPAADGASQRMDDSSFEQIQDVASWIQGQFPCGRAGMAVAEHKAGTRRFYVFGGARYVHQEWFSDVFEFSLEGNQ
ncbi:unnamed protein product [Durusdinium trenchii]|uniref:Uncharacterized protein n=1 Tax=Durusdinium trenchii TaxID=1381693 RepID=A0ABP0KNI5_9DINO